MRIIFLLVLIIGIGMAGYAAYMVMQRFQTYQAEFTDLENQLREAKLGQVDTEIVLVAKSDLRFGSELLRDDVTELQWPKGQTPPNVFSSMESLFGGENTAPRYVLRIMEQGEPILATKVTEFGEDAGISSRLEPGMRAFAISVNVTSGVSGFLQPGDRVDVYWVGNTTGETITKLILEDVDLIAIDQQDDDDFGGIVVARTVTLQVSPLVVAKLVQAQATGDLTLALRGAEDSAATGGVEIDQSAIIVNEIIEVVEERVCTIRTRNGANVVEVVIPCVEGE
ncbi:MAG: Flp pilus assembly protein CpaB [Rhodobacteraceae bacterium]|nr:Flp pilus assembly protein CpaB [Paracoccaceae bacterium]